MIMLHFLVRCLTFLNAFALSTENVFKNKMQKSLTVQKINNKLRAYSLRSYSL